MSNAKWMKLASEAHHLFETNTRPTDLLLGDLLAAMAGKNPGYRADVDELLAKPKRPYTWRQRQIETRRKWAELARENAQEDRA